MTTGFHTPSFPFSPKDHAFSSRLLGDPCTTLLVSGGAPLFTLSEGRGRFGRLRPKPVRGLPRNHRRVTQEPSLGEGIARLELVEGPFKAVESPS